MSQIQRRWKYAAPPWRFAEALTVELDQWLRPALDKGEPVPHATEAADGRVVLAPWVDPAVDGVEVLIALDEAGHGAVLTVRARLADGAADPDDDTRRRIRHRLGRLFGAELRFHVDG